MSHEEELGALEAHLQAKPPAGLARLSAGDLRDLNAAISDVRRAQASELKAAGEAAFSQIPWLLRGPIRKIVG